MGRNTKVKPIGAQDAMDRLMKLSKNKVWLKKLERGDAGAQKLYSDLTRIAATDDRGFALPAPEVAVKFGAGKKYDAGKAPVFRGFIQYFPRAIKSVSMVSAFGAKKYNVAYEEVSYQKVDEGYGRYSDADARHLIEECINPVDADSELEHAQMHAWNAMARLEMLLKGRETSNGTT